MRLRCGTWPCSSLASLEKLGLDFHIWVPGCRFGFYEVALKGTLQVELMSRQLSEVIFPEMDGRLGHSLSSSMAVLGLPACEQERAQVEEEPELSTA